MVGEERLLKTEDGFMIETPAVLLCAVLQIFVKITWKVFQRQSSHKIPFRKQSGGKMESKIRSVQDQGEPHFQSTAFNGCLGFHALGGPYFASPAGP
jgi:hypothetical protein